MVDDTAANEHPKALLRTTEGLSRVLGHLQEIVDSTARILQELIEQEDRSQRIPVTVLDLPDELLSHIFESMMGRRDDAMNPFGILHSASRDARNTSNLALACRRLRTVAIATPHLWTDIISFQPKTVLEQRICRSRGLALNVVIALNTNVSVLPSVLVEFEGALDLIVAQSKRWQYFALQDAPSGYKRHLLDSVLKALYTSTRDLEFPMLGHIYLELESWKRRSLNNTYLQFHDSWTTPILESFCVDNCIPQQGFGDSVIKGRIRHQMANDRMELDDLIAFLKGHPNLEDLQFSFSFDSFVLNFEIDDEDWGMDRDSATFPSLRRLAIQTDAEDDSAARFLGRLDLPALAELSIVLPQYDNWEVSVMHSQVKKCMQIASNWPSLTKLSLSILQLSSGEPESTMDIIFQNLDGLEHLYLEDLRCNAPSSMKGMGQLRTLTLENCLHYNNCFLERAVSEWKKANRLEQLEKVTISGFTSVSEEKMKSLLPAKKHSWKGSIGSGNFEP